MLTHTTFYSFTIVCIIAGYVVPRASPLFYLVL